MNKQGLTYCSAYIGQRWCEKRYNCKRYVYAMETVEQPDSWVKNTEPPADFESNCSYYCPLTNDQTEDCQPAK